MQHAQADNGDAVIPQERATFVSEKDGAVADGGGTACSAQVPASTPTPAAYTVEEQASAGTAQGRDVCDAGGVDDMLVTATEQVRGDDWPCM